MPKNKSKVKKCCENCKFWEPTERYDPDRHQGAGCCVRFPPIPVMCKSLDGTYPSFFHPETGVLCLCGEFKKCKKLRRV